MFTETPLPAEQKPRCMALLQRRDAFAAKHDARFTRFYRLGRDGIDAASADGALERIEGAEAVFKPSAAGATIEAFLPAKALPRAGDAPVSSVSLVALGASAPKPPAAPPAQWVELDVASPTGFEPWAELRAQAVQAAKEASALTPLGISYQPGDPLALERVTYAADSDYLGIETKAEILYSPQTTLGDLEIGYVFTRGTSIGILRGGKLVDLVGISGTPRGIEKRGRGLHVVSYWAGSDQLAGGTWAKWYVTEIRPDGSHEEDLVKEGAPSPDWDDVAELHSPKLDALGLRGTAHTGKDGALRGLEIMWRYDARRGSYEPHARDVPMPKRKPR